MAGHIMEKAQSPVPVPVEVYNEVKSKLTKRLLDPTEEATSSECKIRSTQPLMCASTGKLLCAFEPCIKLCLTLPGVHDYTPYCGAEHARAHSQAERDQLKN